MSSKRAPAALRPVRVSAAIASAYRKRLQASNQQYKRQVDKAANKLLAEINALDRSKPGAFQKQVSRLSTRIESLGRSLNAANTRSIKAVDRFIREARTDNRRKTIMAFRRLMTRDKAIERLAEKKSVVDKAVARLRVRMVDSITDANRDYSDRVQSALYNKLVNPRFNARKALQNSRGIVTRRIKNTVTDQAHALNAAFNRTQLRALGSKRYRWQTKEDEQVRDLHANVNGQVFTWAKRPAETNGHHPGEDFGCRCIPIPLID